MTVMLPGTPKRRRKQVREMRPVGTNRSVRARYTSALERQAEILKAATANLSDVIRSGAERTRVAQMLASAAEETTARIQMVAGTLARAFGADADKANKRATEQALARSLGVDFAKILDTPNTAADVDLAVARNASLIKSIPAKHWDLVGEAVLDNFRGAPLPEGVSLEQRLQDIGGITKNRARFIARDQTAKLNTALNKSRQESNGIESYKWRNAGDERVVGNPGGKYPDGSRGHENHWDRDGKIFRWDDPPADGHPGQAYNCRCVAIPVVDLDKLDALYP